MVIGSDKCYPKRHINHDRQKRYNCKKTAEGGGIFCLGHFKTAFFTKSEGRT